MPTFERNSEGKMLAWPGAGFAHQPLCVVESVHGLYQGCGQWAFTVEGTAIQDADFDRAFEVFLLYPNGDRKWHFGPMAHVNGRCRPMDVPDLVQGEEIAA